MAVKKLKRFPEVQFSSDEVVEVLRNQNIKEVNFSVLGPEGTNISQSSKRWSMEMEIAYKSVYSFCDTPDQSVENARKIRSPSTFPLFVACAVYYDMHRLFFENPDCYVLMDHHYMQLDNMQLAAREAASEIPAGWVIASHPSPKPLLSPLENKIIDSTSNSAAAKSCAEGVVDACMTTETARRIYGLETIHEFGSPVMLFTYGTTPHGVKLLEKYQKRRR